MSTSRSPLLDVLMSYKTTKRLEYRTWDHLHFEWKPCENKKDWTQESVDDRFVSNETNGLNFVAGDPKEPKKSSEWYDIHDAFDHDVYLRHNWKERIGCVIAKETIKPLTGQPQSKKTMSKKQIKNNKNSVDKNKGKNVKSEKKKNTETSAKKSAAKKVKNNAEKKNNTETSAKKSAAKKVKNNAKKKKNKGYIAPAGKVLPAQSSTQQNMTEPMSDHRQQNGFVRVHQQLPRNVMQPLIHQISNRYTYPGGYGYPGGYVNPGGYVYPGGKIWRPMVQTELPPNWNHQVGPVMVLNPGANGFAPQNPILSGETGSHV